jgi:hypothetical protein
LSFSASIFKNGHLIVNKHEKYPIKTIALKNMLTVEC